MSVFSQDKEKRLLELLGEELEIFAKIREMTGRQAKLLEADDNEALEALNKSLNERQPLIEEIDGLHKERTPLMQSYLAFAISPGGRKNEAIESKARQLRNAIADCAAINSGNIDAAKGKKQEYSDRIGKLSIGRKSLGAYAQSVPYNSELFDRKS